MNISVTQLPTPSIPIAAVRSSRWDRAVAFRDAGYQALEAHEHLHAIALFESALELEPALPNTLSGRFNAVWCSVKPASDQCNWRHFDYLQRMLRVGARQGRYLIGEIALASPMLDNELLLSNSRACCEQLFSTIQPAFPAASPGARRSGRMRIGFVGSDFFSQATAYLLTGVIERLDREQFESFAYDCEPRAPGTHDPMNERCKAAYEHFLPFDDLTDLQAAERIHADQIDVLFNLRGVANGRLGIFALRPCAIQVQYLYFPGTSGAGFMDYFVSDEVATPVELEFSFTEKILRLPGCYQPNDDRRVVPENLTRADFGLPPEAIVMANFSQPYKITPDVFDVWCDLLHADDRRLLWLLASDDSVVQNLRREAAVRGIETSRIVFSPRADLGIHLARIRAADLMLDTFPYGGHTLTSDALWAGTPLVTQVGTTLPLAFPTPCCIRPASLPWPFRILQATLPAPMPCCVNRPNCSGCATILTPTGPASSCSIPRCMHSALARCCWG